MVLNTIDYINEGLRQLSDDNFYIETDTDLTNQHKTQINNKIREMHEDKEIDLKCHDYLMDSTGRTSLLYMLPKIHKRLNNPPGRPIVSGNWCPIEKISQLVDFLLQPHVKALPFYIKDTTHFLRTLNQLGRLPANTILATLDVASSYTNIPNNEGLEAARLALYRMRGRGGSRNLSWGGPSWVRGDHQSHGRIQDFRLVGGGGGGGVDGYGDLDIDIVGVLF